MILRIISYKEFMRTCPAMSLTRIDWRASVSKKIALVTMLLMILTVSSSEATDQNSIIGFWSTPDKDALFEIYKCGQLYCGKIYSLQEPYYPSTDKKRAGKPKVDNHNPNPALRNRTLVGMQFMLGFQYEGDNSWAGMIYNPEDGKTYNCKLSMAEDGRLKVRGYVVLPLLGKSQFWTRQDKHVDSGSAYRSP